MYLIISEALHTLESVLIYTWIASVTLFFVVNLLHFAIEIPRIALNFFFRCYHQHKFLHGAHIVAFE